MIPAAVADAAGVTLAQAGPAIIRDTARLPGRIVLNRNRYAAIKAPFAGPVLAVSVASGDRVRRGQVLATIENRESLVSYPVLAPMDGVVLARHTNVGDVADETPIFEMADLSSVWLEVHAFPGEAARLQVGQPVRVQGVPGQVGLQARLTSLLPVASAVSQSVVARAELPNPDGLLRPGMSVTAEVELDQREVPLAVNEAGLQRFRDFTVVFARFGDTYEVRMLELGERDGEWVEVLGGIDPGTPYVVEQSFLIKADVEKSGASHDH
ncbi:MAG: efflux RND transporter periplasmic adaptor subunit [Steroidobacteraceae bacterium]|jgi:cobalt-zinc-cadmium efflux system membrane fusion protein